MEMHHQKLLPARRPVWRSSILKALMTSSALIAAGVTGPQAQTWNIDANGNWGTAGNWTPTSVPNSFNATANLGAAITADRTITLDAPISLNTLNFQSPAHSYTIAPLSGAGTLTFDGGFSAYLNSTATAGQTIGADVVLNKYLNANIGAGGDVTITGGVSGSGGLTKTGAGVLTLSGPGAYTGFATDIYAGTLRAGAANAFAPASFTTMFAGATLDLNGFNQAIGTLSGAGTVLLGDANLTISGSNATFSGQISGDGGSLTSANSGSLRTVLTGDNSYTGGTRVSSGQLQVGNYNTDGAILGPATIDSGALLILHCNDVVGGKCNGSTGGSGTFSGTIVNNGVLETQGGGVLTLSGAITGSGRLVNTQNTTILTADNSYTGGTVAGPKLQVGDGGTTGSLGTGDVSGGNVVFNRSNELIVNNLISGIGAVSQIGSGTTILTTNNTYSGGTAVNAGSTLQIGNGGETGALGDSVQHSIQGTLIFNRSNAYSIDDWLFNDGSIVNAGTGVTTLNGGVVGAGSVSTTAGTLILNSSLNDFSGGATIAAGSTLEVSGGGNPGSGNIKNDGTLIFDREGFLTYAGAISGAGVVRQSGVDAFTLAGNNSYSGGTIIDPNRELRVNASGTLGSGSVQNGGMLSFSAGSSLQTQTIANMITGAGSIDKREAGTTVLTADNNYTGGTSLFQGKLQLGNGGTTGGIANTASVDLQYRPAFGYTILAFNRSDRVVFDAPITGGGKVAQDGAGTTVLIKDNTYTGGTTISAGELQVGDGGTTGALGSGPVTNAGALTFNRSNAFGFDGAITNSGVVTQAGPGATTLGGTISGAGSVTTTAGTLILTANNTYAGGTTITAGTLQLGNGGATGMIAGNVSTGADGVLAFNRSNSLTFGGLISGEGKVIQDGANANVVTELTANNTYSGGTEIKAGTLYVGAIGARGSTTGALGAGPVINDAKLTFNRRNAYSFDGAIANNGVMTKAGEGTTTLGGSISGAGSVSLNVGKLILTADNTYTGPTTIDYRTTLQLGDGGAAGTLGSGAVVDNGVLTINRSGVFEISGVISGSGSLNKMGFGTAILSANNTYTDGTTIEGGTLQLGNGGTAGTIIGNLTNKGVLSFNRSDTLVFDGLIKGGGRVTQDGPGKTVLTANNEYFGDTIITAGTLQLGDGGATGSINSDVINYGTLSFNHTGDNSSWVNDFWGAISGTGRVTQDGANTTRLIGDNTYTGGTIITAGGLQLGDGGETGSIVGDVINDAELSFNRSNTLTLDGVISGTGRVVQKGVGTTILTSDNSYSGGTLISAGTLQIGNGGARGTLGSGPVVDNSVLAINRSGSFLIPGVISGAGRLDQMGPGTTILTGDNTYSGGTTISGGALQLGAGGTTGSIVGDVANDGTLSFNHSNRLVFGGLIAGAGKVSQDGSGTTALTADNLYFGDTTINAGALQLGDGATSGAILNTAKVDVREGGALSFNRSDSVVFDRFITGAGKVTQDGAGATVMTADNAYTGGTLISAGALQLGDGGTTGSIIGDVINNSALSFNRSNLLTFGGAISGTGKVTQDGAGTTVLSADNSYSGGTLISAGTLQIGNGGASGTLGSGPVVDDSVLAINRSGVFEIPGVISGVGRLDQMGPGTTVLTGNNTYSGGTTISGGALQLGDGGATGWILGDVANNGTLIFNRSDAVTFDPTIAGTGGVIQMGQGSTNLTAANTYTGPTLVQAGKLSINGSITSDTTVAPGATLGGNGTIFGAVMNYGVVAPGNSIGQLNIVGSYTQAAGSFYQVELNPAGQADRIMVSGAPGAATIKGGTVAVQAVNAIYPLTYKYTIVTATGGVTGKYAGLTSNLAFLRPMITYDANNVYLEASVNTPTVDYTCGATTANQNAVATALNQADGAATGDFANVIGALFGLNNGQGSAALDAMSGQPYSAFGTANVFSASLFGSGLRQQMALARQGGGGGNRATIRTADGKPSRLSSWASGIGGTRTVDGGASAGAARVCGGWTPGRTAGQMFNAAGVMGGVDYRVNPSTLVGFGLGWAGGNDWTRGFDGRGESDSLTMSTYGAFTAGAAYADLLTGYAYNANRMTRRIAIPGLGERAARGTAGAPQWYGQAEFGYRFGLDRAATSTLTPFARVEATTIAQRAFTERGAEGLNLAVAGQRTSSLRSVLGAEFTTAWKMGWREPLGLQLRAGHAHDYADMSRPVTAAFAAAPGSRFTLQGAAPPRDSATLGLRLWTVVDAHYWPFLRYDGDLARGADSHAFNAGLRVNW